MIPSILWPIIKIIGAGIALALTHKLDMRYSSNKLLKVISMIAIIAIAAWALYDLFKLAGII